MPNIPDYLIEAILRYGAECRAEAQGELRSQMAELLGLREAKRDLMPPPPLPGYREKSQPLEAVQQTYAYGTISKVVKQVMRESPRTGLTITEIISRAARDWNAPVTKPQARDALKRMKAHGEAHCLGRRTWIATPRLRGEEAPDENGAAATLPLTAPDAGEVGASPIENVVDFGRPR